MTIYVDADACPVKKIIVQQAKKRAIPVVMLIDTSHELQDDYAQVITVAKGPDSVDFKLVTLVHSGDLVVTQDTGVAAMALGKGAQCINQNGLMYTNSNIDMMLYTRHENSRARRRGHYTAVPARTKQDDEAFCRAFCALLDKTQEGDL